MWRLYLYCSLILFVIVPGIRTSPSLAQRSSAYDVIAAANGPPALQSDPFLMSIAQAHSDYQASTGTVTNTGPTTAPNDPFVVSTPREDGAIIHVVRYGQSLIGIADAYDVALNDILQLNNFTLDTVIFPNEQIIVQVGNTPTASLSPTATRPTSTASVTATKSTPTPRGTFTQNPTSSLTPSGTPAPIPRGRERLVIGAVVMASIILVAVITSGLLAGRSKDSETE